MRSAARERGCSAARALAARMPLAAASPVDVEALARRLGARITRGKLDGAYARHVTIGGRAVIRLNERLAHRGTQRFSIAHELGHLVLAHDAPAVAELCASGTSKGAVNRQAEAEANGFAAELLMPEHAITARCVGETPDLSLVSAIADAHAVSLLAAAVRMVELSTECCAAALVQEGRVAWAVTSRSFDGKVARGRVVDLQSQAPRCRQEDVSRVAFGRVAAHLWIDGETRVRPSVLEQTIWISDLRAVLTLLWSPASTDPRA